MAERAVDLGGIDWDAVHRLERGTLSDPFGLLGLHGDQLRAFKPGADRVEVVRPRGKKVLATLDRISDGGLFAGTVGFAFAFWCFRLALFFVTFWTLDPPPA